MKKRIEIKLKCKRTNNLRFIPIGGGGGCGGGDTLLVIYANSKSAVKNTTTHTLNQNGIQQCV